MGVSKLKIPKNCEYCGNQFEAKTVSTRFCSRACTNKAGNDKKKAERKEAKQQESGSKTQELRKKSHSTV